MQVSSLSLPPQHCSTPPCLQHTFGLQHGQPTNLDSFYKQLETWTTTHAREGQHQGQQHGMKKLELLDKQLITISTR
jgi:hypothetical protein